MRKLVITCGDALAAALLDVLTKSNDVFSVASADMEQNPSESKPKRTRRPSTNKVNRTIQAVLYCGGMNEKFQAPDVVPFLLRLGLNPSSASPAISQSIKQGLVARTAHGLCLLTDDGLKVLKSLPPALPME